MKTITTMILMSCVNLFGYSQTIENSITQTSHPKTVQFSQEVYRDCPQYLSEQFLLQYSSEIYQVSIIEIPANQQTDFPLLSSVPLKNKCNPDLQNEVSNFDPSNFNPLKYFFNFSTEVDVNYQVDNAPYVIHISHK